MLQTIRIVNLLLIFSLTERTVKSDSHIIVRPTDSYPSECDRRNYTACDTLDNLIASNASIFNDTNSSIVFLAGTHSLNVSGTHHLVVDGVITTTWRGEGIRESTIVCDHSLMFVFTNFTSLQIQNLQFSNCGYRLPSTFQRIISFNDSSNMPNLAAAIAIDNVHSIMIENVVIHESQGYGLLVVNAMGNMSIQSCLFLENNKKYSGYHRNSNTDAYIGGNIMIILNSQLSVYKNSESIHIAINNNIIRGGRDTSRLSAVTECHRYDSRRSSFPYRASGLTLINLQNIRQLFVDISYTNFTNNIGNHNIPAMLIHENSTVVSQYFVTHCQFTEEGTFRFTVYATKEGKAVSPFKLVTIKYCNFIRGANHSLLVCLHPGYHHIYHIIIQSCVFERFTGYSKRNSALKVSYGESKKKKGCPNIRVVVKSTKFRNNKGGVAEYVLPKSDYSKKQTKPCLLLLIEGCTHENNTATSKTPTVKITPSQRTSQRFWEHPNCLNQNGINLEQIKIMNTAFLNNSFRGLEVHKMFFTIENCNFQKSTNTALKIVSSIVVMNGINTISNNSGERGGGICLDNSIMHFSSHSVSIIKQNKADYGGGIFASPIFTEIKSFRANLCSLDFDNNATNISIKLEQNKATYGGNSVFGALYETCYRVSKRGIYNKFSFEHNFTKFFLINWNLENEVSSEPNKICLCSNSKPTKKCSSFNVSAFSGQSFNISLAAVGQFQSKTIQVVVKGNLCSPGETTCKPNYSGDLGLGESLQALLPCTNISYTVNSVEKTTRIEVVVDQGSLKSLKGSIKISPFRINVKINPCPVGFTLTDDVGKLHTCECIKYLKKQKIGCDKIFGRVIISGIEWIGFHTKHPKNITVHKSCTYDYCLPGTKTINLTRPEEQCNFNRSGVLCGACQAGHSMMLGSSNCDQCSDIYLLLIIPFALAGVALVVLLLKCNLTVSVGHINGIIFYANFVRVNKALLFPNQGMAYQIFSTFVAWLNLDLGIEICFFENMDSYAKVWLQFVFPVYLWIIVGFIIIAAHFSSRLCRWIGNNSVPVLATLFLFSYAKLLRTIISVVAFTFIDFEDGSYITVWLQDGNIEYFSPKHIPLFLMALVFVVFYVFPLTLLILLAPCLQAQSHHKALKWVNRLKPFLDAYQGPYSNKFRYWTGLFLIIRLLLFIIHASNYENDPSVSFFPTIMIVFPFAMLCLVKKKIYRHKLANHIETVSLLNVVTLSAVNWLLTSTGYGKWHPIREYTTYISVALMITLFLGIICYQIATRMYSNYWTRSKQQTNDQLQETESVKIVKNGHPTCTFSVVELEHLEEPLLDSD